MHPVGNQGLHQATDRARYNNAICECRSLGSHKLPRWCVSSLRETPSALCFLCTCTDKDCGVQVDPFYFYKSWVCICTVFVYVCEGVKAVILSMSKQTPKNCGSVPGANLLDVLVYELLRMSRGRGFSADRWHAESAEPWQKRPRWSYLMSLSTACTGSKWKICSPGLGHCFQIILSRQKFASEFNFFILFFLSFFFRTFNLRNDPTWNTCR